MKKIISILFAALISLGFVSSVNAASENQGQITVENAVVGKEYEIYRVFDLKLSSTGKVSYTINSNWVAFFASDAGKAYLVSENNAEGTLSSIVVGEDVKYIAITTSNVSEFAEAALAYAASINYVDTKTATSTDETATTTNLVFDKLALGYYLVYPKGATEVINGSICSLTNTVPSAKVSPKAEYPEIDKESDDEDGSVEVGQKITYTITGSVPNTTGFRTYTYKVSDEMTEGLHFNDDVVVTIVATDEDGEDVVLSAKDYTYTPNAKGFELNINMVNYQNYVGQTVTIVYSATVTEAAINKVDTNKATLTYSRNPKDTNDVVTTPPVEVVTYTANITINKFDAKDETIVLEGAKFVLRNAAGKYYKATYTTDSETGVKTLVKVEWVDSINDATVAVTNADGVTSFEGIADGKYDLIETEAPAGYNKLTAPKSVEVKRNTVTAETTTISTTPVDVPNASGTELPGTGGIGTKIFMTVGSTLALGALVIMVTNKRIASATI